MRRPAGAADQGPGEGGRARALDECPVPGASRHLHIAGERRGGVPGERVPVGAEGEEVRQAQVPTDSPRRKGKGSGEGSSGENGEGSYGWQGPCGGGCARSYFPMKGSTAMRRMLACILEQERDKRSGSSSAMSQKDLFPLPVHYVDEVCEEDRAEVCTWVKLMVVVLNFLVLYLQTTRPAMTPGVNEAQKACITSLRAAVETVVKEAPEVKPLSTMATHLKQARFDYAGEPVAVQPRGRLLFSPPSTLCRLLWSLCWRGVRHSYSPRSNGQSHLPYPAWEHHIRSGPRSARQLMRGRWWSQCVKVKFSRTTRVGLCSTGLWQ